MSQPLRFAYISIVIAVHEASDTASISCGLGPSSVPPLSSGSSTVSSCLRTETECLRPSLSTRCAFAFMICLQLSIQRVEHEPRRDLRIEEGRLRRHRLARLRHRAHLLDGSGTHEEGGVGTARLDGIARLCEVARVAKAALVRHV